MFKEQTLTQLTVCLYVHCEIGQVIEKIIYPYDLANTAWKVK